MGSDASMRVVGTILRIELHTISAKFEHLAPREVAKLQLDIERATNDAGDDLDIRNLTGLSFQGPPELVPAFSAGDRVQIETSPEAQLHILNIKAAPLS